MYLIKKVRHKNQLFRMENETNESREFHEIMVHYKVDCNLDNMIRLIENLEKL